MAGGPDGQPSASMVANANSPAQPHDPPRIGKVQTRILAEQLRCRSVVRLGRLDLIFKQAKIDCPTVATDGRPPLPAAGVPGDSFESRCCVVMVSFVTRILSRRAHAKIVPTVVMPVAVDVVDDHSCRRVHDESVHIDILAPDRAARITRTSPHRVPPVPVEPFEIRRIDHRRLAVAEADIANALVFLRNICRRVLPFPPESPAVRHLLAGGHLR